MDSHVVRQLAFSIVQFLRSQLENSASSSCLREESAESVEVALQCLETAYGLTEESFPHQTRSLYDIYSDYIKNDPTFMSQTGHHNMGPPATPEDREEGERLKNEGNQLIREERYTEALDCYTRAIGKDSRNAVFYCNRAAAHTKINNHQEAIQDCKRALAIEPNYSKAFGRMGLAYSTLNNDAMAKDCYQKALELEPDNESYKCNLQISIEKLEAQSQQNSTGVESSFPGFGGGGGGGFNLGALGNLAGMASGGPGQPELQGFLNNPALMNMATQLMSNPSMQNMMASLLGSGGGGGGGAAATGAGQEGPTNGNVSGPSSTPPTAPEPTPGTAPAQGQSFEALLTAGRQLAEQMQAQHPEIVEQLRSQINRNMDPGDNSNDQQPPNT